MAHTIFRLRAYLHHRLKSFRNRNGFGIHSPFAFNLIYNIINPKEKYAYYCYENIEYQRQKLLHDNRKIKPDNGKTKTIKQIARIALSPVQDIQQIFRLVQFVKPNNIIEMGTSLGIGTAYLASFNSQIPIISIDHNSDVQKIAQSITEQLKINNVTYVSKDFDEALDSILKEHTSLDFIFIDGNHKGDAIQHYYKRLKTHIHNRSVIIFHDIHWSKDMNTAWQDIFNDSDVTVSIECYNMGILFFNKELNKQHFFA